MATQGGVCLAAAVEESASLPFVIPSAAEGPAVQRTFLENVFRPSEWGFFSSTSFELKDLRVDTLIRLNHGCDRETFLYPFPAGAVLNGSHCIERSHCPSNIIHQKPCHPMLDHFAAGTKIHRDHRNTRRVRFGENQTKPLWNGIQMKQGKSLGKQSILLFHTNRPHVANSALVEMRLNFAPEVARILHNAGNQQPAATLFRRLDRQVHTFVRMDPPDKDEIIAPA